MKLLNLISRVSMICIAASLIAVSAYAAENSGGAPRTADAEKLEAASKYYIDSLISGFRKGRELIGAPVPDAELQAKIRKIAVKWLKSKLLPYLEGRPGALDSWIAAQNAPEIRGVNDKLMTVNTIYEFQQLMVEADQMTRANFPELYAALSTPKGKRLMLELQRKIAIESQRQLLEQMKKRKSDDTTE